MRLKQIIFSFFLVVLFSCENNNSILSEKTLIIASKKSDCVGLLAQKCLLIKENDQQNWEYFYDSIIGFTYEEGFEYKVLISEKEIESPTQDASSIEYKLINVVSKLKKVSENLPN